MAEAPKAILFDLGNVLLRLKTDDLLKRMLANQSGLDTQAFLTDLRSQGSAHEAYERGQITGLEFYRHLLARWKLSWSYEEWLKNWNDYFLPNPPMEVLLAELVQMGGLRFFVLSNTNREHMAHVRRVYRFFDVVEQVFASSDLGLRKPEPEFFQTAIQKIGLPVGDILFIDDVARFVEAARARGLRAFHYTFNDLELKAYLRENGLNLPVLENRPGHLGC